MYEEGFIHARGLLTVTLVYRSRRRSYPSSISGMRRPTSTHPFSIPVFAATNPIIAARKYLIYLGHCKLGSLDFILDELRSIGTTSRNTPACHMIAKAGIEQSPESIQHWKVLLAFGEYSSMACRSSTVYDNAPVYSKRSARSRLTTITVNNQTTSKDA